MPAPADIDAYIAAQSDPARGILNQLRATIHAAVPDATESISYGMAAFHFQGRPLAYLAAWKHHIGLYPVAFDTPFESEIAPLRAAKDSVHLKYKNPVPYDLVGRIVALRARTIADQG
jgi:uncharacterized protein YdhG (YjbR/CyaY superfamily)